MHDNTTEQRIAAIELRNERVARDKAWEVSLTRRFVVALCTYVVAYVWMREIGNDAPYLNAAVPTGGYLLSTFSLPFLRTLWEKHTL